MGFPLNIGKVWLKEQAGGWGTAETSFAAANHISAKVFLPKLVQEALVAETFRGGYHNHAVEGGSREGAEFTIEHVLQGSSLTTPAADPVENPDALALRSALGNGAAYGYRANQLNLAGQTTTLIKFLNNQATSAGSGMAMIVPLLGGGREIVWNKTFTDGATDDFVPWYTMAAAADPGGGTNVVYGSRVSWLSLTQPTPFTGQVNLGQADGNAGVRFRDCVVTGGKATFEAGKQPIISHTSKAGYWSITGSWVPAIYANNYPELPMISGAGGARVKYGGSATYFPKVELEWTQTVEAVRNLGATDAFGKWIMTERDFTLTITEVVTDYSALLYLPGVENATGLQVDICTTPGRGASVFMPTYQTVGISEDEAAGNILVRKTAYKSRITTVETAGANAAQSPVRVAIF